MGWLWLIPAAVLLALLLVCAAAWRCVRFIVYGRRQTYEAVRAREQAQFSGAYDAYDNVWRRTPFTLAAEGASLSGEYAINPRGAGVAVFSHGHTVNRMASVKYADIFYRLGWSVVLYDQRYFGASTGARCTLGQREADDLCRVVAFARKTFGPDCRVALFGESMGAATALRALEWERPALVVADCPFADTLTLMRYMLPFRAKLPAFPLVPLAWLIGRLLYGYDMQAVSPVKSLAKAEVPVCLIHGLADTYIPCAHSKMLYAACCDARSELHLVPGAHHAGSIAADKAGYEAIICNFIDKITGEEQSNETDGTDRDQL